MLSFSTAERSLDHQLGRKVKMEDPLKKLQHSPLGETKFVSEWTMDVLIDIDHSKKRKLRFRRQILKPTKTREELDLPENFVKRQPITDLLNIPVEIDCYIRMRLLSGKVDWRWRRQDAITTVESMQTMYTDLRYLCNGRWECEAGPDDICDTIRFGARARPKGSPPTKDAFNMNIVLDWGSDGVLPITIDPDILNPRS
ncbi:MAG TPA: nucleotide synthetase [Allosphingosinicella sp.]